MPATCEPIVKESVSATDFREHLAHYLNMTKSNAAVLIEIRGRGSKYVVDKDWLDNLVKEQESILATIDILLDPELTTRLLKTAQTVDDDLRAGRLRTMSEVFGAV
ncbi:MAG: hypothetical protein ACYC92_11900 [Candidatus Acidiferrales bacterium]